MYHKSNLVADLDDGIVWLDVYVTAQWWVNRMEVHLY